MVKQKCKDNILTHVLKAMFLIGQQSWIHSIFSAILGIIIPLLFTSHSYVWFSILICILILDILYAYICNMYKSKLYIQRKFSSDVLAEQSSLIKSIIIEIDNNKNWKNTIFKTVSGLVCEKIFQNFKEIYNCETRVSVEYVFNKKTSNTSNSEKYVKMSGRRSHHRSTVKKSKPLCSRNNYFSYKIFINNNKGINILNKTQIQDESIWYKNPNNSSIDIKNILALL